jgi:hypothetical protein
MFTGSGAIEGGIKAIVVQRTKQSGIRWTVNGAADTIALRCQPPVGRATAHLLDSLHSVQSNVAALRGAGRPPDACKR